MNNDSPLIFISYATADRSRVVGFYDHLKREGFNVWIDCKDIKGGHNIEYAIRSALDKAEIVVVFMSGNSTGHRGYVQHELRLALEKAREKLISDIYLVPVLLDQGMEIPREVLDIHCIDGSLPNACEELIGSISHQLGQIRSETQDVQRRTNVTWSKKTHRDSWEGLPGYVAEFSILVLSSDKYKPINDITNVILGEMTKLMMEQRQVRWDQPATPSVPSFAQSQTNAFHASCGEPFIKGSVLSISYNVFSYWAGAAHSNTYHRTFSFFLEPVMLIPRIELAFQDQGEALEVIKTGIRRELLADSSDSSDSSRDWVWRGTDHWDNLQSFVFRDDAIEFLFAPYTVGPYSRGSQSALIKYSEIVQLMRHEFVHALDISHLNCR